MFCALAGCTSPVARHRLPSPVARHVSGPVAPLAVTRWPVARHVCTSPVARHVSGPVAPLAVTGCTSPAGRLLVTFERHRLHVTSADRCPAGRHRLPSPLAGCTSPVARHRLHVTSADPLPRWPSPAGRLLVSGPAGRHRSAGCTSPVARHVSGPGCPAGRHPLAGCSSATRWPSPLAGCSSPVARHRLHVTSADPLPRWPSPAGRHPLQCHRFYPALVSGPVARQRTRWPVARHV